VQYIKCVYVFVVFVCSVCVCVSVCLRVVYLVLCAYVHEYTQLFAICVTQVLLQTEMIEEQVKPKGILTQNTHHNNHSKNQECRAVLNVTAHALATIP